MLAAIWISGMTFSLLKVFRAREEGEMALVIRLEAEAQRSLMRVRRWPSSSALASNMFSITRGRRVVAGLERSLQRARGSNMLPRSRSSWNVDAMPEKSNVTSGETYSISNATICCLRSSKCFNKKSCPSICAFWDVRMIDAR